MSKIYYVYICASARNGTLREWKINLIQSHNVEWRDLYETLNA
jgi:predicted GIY-YIG superfamily endonuclease